MPFETFATESRDCWRSSAVT